MNETEAQGRCPNCRMKPHLCLCGLIVPRSIKTELSVVMHISEREKSTNTVRLLKLLVPQTQVIYHGERDKKATLPTTTRARYLLFPDDSALELNDAFAAAHPNGISLVVPDGNWHQARKMTHRHPELISLPRVRVSGAGGTLFAVRRAPRGGFLSTIEAIALALTPFEGAELAQELNKILYEMVRRTLWSRISSAPMPPDFTPAISTSSMNKG